MSPALQLFIVAATLLIAYAVMPRHRPGRYTSTARQRRAWRRERLVVAYRNRRKVS